MKSKFGQKFNHDNHASTYDKNVSHEAHEIRVGYRKVIETVASIANEATVNKDVHILELGCGTGELTKELQGYEKLICIDISKEMISLAKTKVDKDSKIEFLKTDLLEYVMSTKETFDVVVSTYTLHHLTEKEKKLFLERLEHIVILGGRAIFGDLMFKNEKEKTNICKQFIHEDRQHLIDEIQDEFYWFVDPALNILTENGFEATTEQISTLSWIIEARREK